MPQHEAIIKIENVSKQFKIGTKTEEIVLANALEDINVEIKSTDFAIIYGPSGCGKSTLLNTIIGLEPPDKGKVRVRDKDIYKLNEDERANFRNTKFGIIYQQPIWIKSLSLLKNVALPLLIQGEHESVAKKKARSLLTDFGLEKRLNNKPTEISGGQQQKASAARALIHNPWILIADEPTGNLDTHSSDEMMNFFQKLNKESKRTIIMVTHNLIYLPMATKKIAMIDGKVSSEDIKVKKQIETELKKI